jgi:heme/copper-type cytochrome/quinol oxidase subunit 2
MSWRTRDMESNSPIHTSRRNPRFYVIILAAVLAILVVGFVIYQSGYLTPVNTTDNTLTPGDLGLMKATCSSLGLGTNSTTSANTTNKAVGQATSNPSSSHAYFLIVESDPGNPYEGMNGSAYQPPNTSWPILHVSKGQTVTIHVINCASSEAHGFAIDHYFNNGLTAEPGGSYNVTFTADQTGTFRVYCNVFCAIHPLMQNGQLIVS